MTVTSPTRPAALPVVPGSGVLAWYDALDEDPPGHRLEVLEEHLLVSPSPVSEHQDRTRGLANVIDEALSDTRWEVREDLEWPLEHPVAGLGSRLRPDVSVLDPDAPEDAPRLVTAEVLSPSDHQRLVAGEPETRIEGKRRVYGYGGVTLHLEVDLVDDIVQLRAYVNRDGTLELIVTARGDEPLVLDEPVHLELVPAELEGWLRRHLKALEDALAEERARAEEAEERAARAEAALREVVGGSP